MIERALSDVLDGSLDSVGITKFGGLRWFFPGTLYIWQTKVRQ
jgi:hypothetical protein